MAKAHGDEHPYDTAHDSHGIALRIKEAAREVGRPVFFAVMIIIIVFAPLFSLEGLEGVEGKLFQPMAISIVLAMLASLLVALVVVPALATYFFTHGVKHKDGFVMPPLTALYRKALPVAQQQRKMVVTVALGLFLGSLALFVSGHRIRTRAGGGHTEYKNHAGTVIQSGYGACCRGKTGSCITDLSRGDLCDQPGGPAGNRG